jgi:uncharacterized protein YndB with AHSA1/START domain
MTQQLDDAGRKGEIIIDGDYATIVFKRLLRHPPQAVWDAITKPDELKEWLMCSSAKIDGRAGGSVDMVAGPAQFHVTGKVLTWDPPRVFEHEWKVAAGPHMPKGENAVFRYDLAALGETTMLIVTYRKLTRETCGGFAPGTHVLLDRLEAQLAGEPLPEWMPRFEALRSSYPQWQK